MSSGMDPPVQNIKAPIHPLLPPENNPHTRVKSGKTNTHQYTEYGHQTTKQLNNYPNCNNYINYTKCIKLP